jgi:hypothetical protein
MTDAVPGSRTEYILAACTNSFCGGKYWRQDVIGKWLPGSGIDREEREGRLGKSYLTRLDSLRKRWCLGMRT